MDSYLDILGHIPVVAFLVVAVEGVTHRPPLPHILWVAQFVDDCVEIVATAVGPVRVLDKLIATHILPILFLIDRRSFLEDPSIAADFAAVANAMILAVLARVRRLGMEADHVPVNVHVLVLTAP